MKRDFAVMISKILVLVAAVFVSTASLFMIHRPEIPEELKKTQ
ncbi:cyclic lactone autoinducer peptide [Cohnella endophytica]|uniref:Cyclic lactone autoinducer peptide n=1 Tax=Cohnella endophytica TaxID=2419778 RepID=A0A494XTR1_9BACL|nr:cyclic lactone autoinducer peptide [Cohnella endophytica]RKP54023.1 cyclic lactone autoinducer peptide [Cohnella endophytica]